MKSGKTTFAQTSKSTPGQLHDARSPLTGTEKDTLGILTIKWNTGKTSKATGFHIHTISATQVGLSGKIDSGLFKGKKVTGKVNFGLTGKAADGDCVNTDLKKVKYSAAGELRRQVTNLRS